MAKKKGTGLLMVWTDVPADQEEEFNRWYNEEHLAERLCHPWLLERCPLRGDSKGGQSTWRIMS